jgi:AmmeMemoRadiSam system protein B
MRKPVVSGQFYESDPEQLRAQVMGFLEKARVLKTKVLGAISPHAGYAFSGQCAAYSYNMLKDEGPETYILLGVNHSGHGMANFAVSFDDFETPLGTVENDKQFSKELVKLKNVEHNELSHGNEHSLEVQLPFLQCIKKNYELKIVPIVIMSHNIELCKRVAQDIVNVAKKLKRKVKIVASSDFTHYGSNYGFLPFPPTEAKTKLKEFDMKAIELVEKLDSKEFLDFASRATICGSGAIATCIEICKLLGAKKARLLKYYTSGDIIGDYDNAVGYASITFE